MTTSEILCSSLQVSSKGLSGFEIPPLDLELLNVALENEPIPEPTAAEVAAYLFLRRSIGN